MRRNVIEIGAATAIAAAYLGFAQLHRPVQEQPTRPIVQPYDRQVPYTTAEQGMIVALNAPKESEMVPIVDTRRKLISHIEGIKELAGRQGGKRLQGILQRDFSYEVDAGGFSRHGTIRQSEEIDASKGIPQYNFPLADIMLEIITNNPPKPGERISWPFEVATSYTQNGKTIGVSFAALSNPQGDGWRFIDRRRIEQDPTPPGGY